LISKNNICIIDSVSSLAKEVNLPRETVSRILSNLEKEKYLIKEKNTIHIL
jgi:DNA-binding IclR family transcriptional regulator